MAQRLDYAGRAAGGCGTCRARGIERALGELRSLGYLEGAFSSARRPSAGWDPAQTLIGLLRQMKSDIGWTGSAPTASSAQLTGSAGAMHASRIPLIALRWDDGPQQGTIQLPAQ